MKRIILVFCLVVGVMGLAINYAMADNYPQKPVRFIINFNAGGTSDVAARVMGAIVEKALNQSFVYMNRPGAGGTLGVAEIARARPDGYTIGTCNMPALSIIPQMREVPYDPLNGFTHIAAILPYEYGVVVRGDSPWNTWEEFVEYLKANPGDATYGSVGTGTTNHLAMARIAKELGLDWKHVPFEGGVKATAALLGDHVDAINNTTASMISSIRAGQLRVLMVTSEGRFSATPDVPTMEEKGFSFSQISYMSIIGPAGMPEPIRAKLEQAFKAAVEDPSVKADLAKLDMNPRFVSGKDYEALVSRMSQEWGALLPDLGVPLKK